MDLGAGRNRRREFEEKDATDVALGLQFVVGLQTATAVQLMAGDLDDSGAIEINDIVAILRYIVGIGVL